MPRARDPNEPPGSLIRCAAKGCGDFIAHYYLSGSAWLSIVEANGWTRDGGSSRYYCKRHASLAAEPLSPLQPALL